MKAEILAGPVRVTSDDRWVMGKWDLQMDVSIGKALSGNLHEFLDELVVLFSPSSTLAQSKIQVIFEQFLILEPRLAESCRSEFESRKPYTCSTIQHNRQLAGWMDPSTESRDHQLRDGDENGPDALVSDPQNLQSHSVSAVFCCHGLPYRFAVTDNDVINILCSSKAGQRLLDRRLIPDIQETSFRLPEYSRVILDGISFGRSVDDAKHLLEMALQKLSVTFSTLDPCIVQEGVFSQTL